MATDEIRGALDRLKEWADTIQHYVYRTVVQGTWVGHEEFRADLALVESALRALVPPRQRCDDGAVCVQDATHRGAEVMQRDDPWTCQFCHETSPSQEWKFNRERCPMCNRKYDWLLAQDSEKD